MNNNENSITIDATEFHLLEYICKEIVPGYSLEDDNDGRRHEFRDLADKCDEKVAEHALMVLKDLSEAHKPHMLTARFLKNVILQTSQKIDALEQELQRLKDEANMFDVIDTALSSHYKEFKVAVNDKEDDELF